MMVQLYAGLRAYMPVLVADCDGLALQRLRDQKVRGAAIVGEQHGELEADISISDLRHALIIACCH